MLKVYGSNRAWVGRKTKAGLCHNHDNAPNKILFKEWDASQLGLVHMLHLARGDEWKADS